MRSANAVFTSSKAVPRGRPSLEGLKCCSNFKTRSCCFIASVVTVTGGLCGSPGDEKCVRRCDSWPAALIDNRLIYDDRYKRRRRTRKRLTYAVRNMSSMSQAKRTSAIVLTKRSAIIRGSYCRKLPLSGLKCFDANIPSAATSRLTPPCKCIIFVSMSLSVMPSNRILFVDNSYSVPERAQAQPNAFEIGRQYLSGRCPRCSLNHAEQASARSHQPCTPAAISSSVSQHDFKTKMKRVWDAGTATQAKRKQKCFRRVSKYKYIRRSTYRCCNHSPGPR